MSWTRRDTLAVLGLVAAPFALWWRLLVPGAGRHYLAPGDFVDQFYAFAHLETARLAAGALPLWNPFAYAGTPFWADIQSAVAYPPSLAVVLSAAHTLGRLPFLALELEALAHLALAGVLTYLFARRTLRSRPGALVAALAFGLGGYLTGYPPLQLAVLEANAWLPLALLAADGIAHREHPLDPPLLALGVGMTVLAGHPQSALLAGYGLLAYLAWHTRPWRRSGGGWRWRPWMRAAMAVAAGLALSAAGWWPALEYQQLSNRIALDLTTAGHGFPPRELVGLALPGVTQWSPLYVGVLPLLLAIAAGWSALTADGKRASRTRFWVALGLAALVLALGANAAAFEWLYLLAPGYDLFRGQERHALWVSFSLAMLAGWGTALWLGKDHGAIARTVARGSAVLAALGLLVLAFGTTSADGAHVLLFAGATALLVAGRTLPRVPHRAWLAGIALVVALDLYGVGATVNLVPAAPGELQADPLISAMQMAVDGRVQNDDRLPRNFGVLHGVPSTSGASPLRLRTFDRLREGLTPANEARLFDLLAVSHVLTWRAELPVPSEPLMTRPAADGTTVLHALELPSPLVWRAPNATCVPDDDAALAQLRAPDFDPLSTVLLHEGACAASGGGGTLAVARQTIGRTVVRTDGDQPAWVVFSEIHYPGWQATVDGAPAPVLRADIALMAVAVPAGAHEVELRFTAPRVRQGLLVSLLTAIGLAGWLAWTTRRLRSDAQTAGHAPA